jgi:HSP20 family protein
LPALRPFEEFEKMFDQYFSRNWMRPFDKDWPSFSSLKAFEGKAPSVDVIDRDNEVLVKAELPGVDKKDIDVSVTSNTVSINGSSRKEEKEEKGDYYHHEISKGNFSRKLSLPAEIDESKTSATFKDGVLELTLPKLKKSRHQSVKVN